MNFSIKTRPINFRMFTFFIYCLLIFPTKVESQSSIQDLDKTFQGIVKKGKLAGFGAALFTKDSIIYCKGFGYKDLNTKAAYTQATTQIIASISKTFVATALMKAQELGLLNLDDPINQYLPFPVNHPYFPNEKITIRHLATHTSGLKYSELMTDHYAYQNPSYSLERMLKEYLSTDGKWYKKSNFMKGKPGQLGDYSNTGAALAAYVIECAAKISFPKFTELHIFKPLGFESTIWYTGETSKKMATHYINADDGSFVEEIRLKDGIYPCGDLVTNVKELTIYCQMIMNKGVYKNIRILSEASVKEMLTCKKIKTMEGSKQKQGIFWYASKNELGIPRKVIGHNGGDDGIYTMMFFDKKNRGYLLIANSSRTEENIMTMALIYQSLYRYGKTLDL